MGLPEQYIILSTLALALKKDIKNMDNKLLRAISTPTLQRVEADLKRVAQQLKVTGRGITVKKYKGELRYHCVGNGIESDIEFTKEELQRLCEEKAMEYIKEGRD